MADSHDILNLDEHPAALRRIEERVRERTAALEAAYRELREDTRLQRAIFETASYAIVVSGPDGVIRTLNPAAERMFGYAAHEVVGRHTPIIWHDPHELRARAGELGGQIDPDTYEFQAIEQSGEQMESEWTLVRKDGTRFPGAVLAIRMQDSAGRLTGFLAIIRDITRRRQTEEALRLANAELARTARLKDEFLASISHELRTPLNAILGRAETLQEQLHGPLNERQLRSARSIEESGRHLLELINDILDLSKIEAGRLELNLAPVAVAPLCQSCLRMVSQAASHKRVAISAQLEDGVASIMADERRLKQVLVNLLTNAVKFTPEGGAVGLEVQVDRRAGELRLTVWDTGIGIAKEHAGRIFKPFVQLDSRLSREYGGTGLGLALVERMTTLHGGRVSVESEPGHGSRFTVALPLRAPAGGEGLPQPAPHQQALQIPLAASAASTPPLVLIADDNRDNVMVFREYLTRQGYRVESAGDGCEAVTRAAELRPAVILMDIQMPGMDGLEAIARIRAAAGGPPVPIIALTALAMPGDRERCLAAGADDYLSKPVGLRDLVRTIQRHLGAYQEAPSR